MRFSVTLRKSRPAPTRLPNTVFKGGAGARDEERGEKGKASTLYKPSALVPRSSSLRKMEVIRTVAELRERLRREPQVACVPTMGNIHDGHLSLVRIARSHAPVTVSTIFVNRLQF